MLISGAVCQVWKNFGSKYLDLFSLYIFWNICEKGEMHWMRRCVFDKAYTNELTRQMCFGWTLSFNWLINSFSSWADAKSFFSILYYVSVKLEASFINTPIIVIVYGSSWRVVFWGIILIAEIEINILWQYYSNYYFDHYNSQCSFTYLVRYKVQ